MQAEENGHWHVDVVEAHRSTDAATEPGEYDGFPFRAGLSIGPYSVLIFAMIERRSSRAMDRPMRTTTTWRLGPMRIGIP